MVSLGLTFFVSTLYGHLVSSWDSGASDEPPSMQGALLVSLLASALEAMFRGLALALFRCSLAMVRRGSVVALAAASGVVLLGIAYPLGLALSQHLCAYFHHLFAQLLVSQAIRGLPMAVTATSLQYLALQMLGREPDLELQ